MENLTLLPGGSGPRRARRRTRVVAAFVGASLLTGAAACSSGGGAEVVVYSGRSTELIEPLLDRFADETGISVAFKQADSADLALTIDQEGELSPADVFISQSPGATAYLDAKGRLGALPAGVLDRVDPSMRSADGTWVGLSGRVRVLVYNPDQVGEDELPDSVLDIVDDPWAGRVAIAPGNGSFQDFVSAMRASIGDDETSAWLEALAGQDAPTYANNNAIVDAVARGEVAMGLVNHYYLEQRKVEEPDITAANHVFPDGDVGSMVLVSAAAVLEGAPHKAEAERLVEFLLSEESQRYFAEETLEYPLAGGVAPAGGLPPLESLALAPVDFGVLGDDFTGTLELIRAAGLTD